jgi:hypothetical protein
MRKFVTYDNSKYPIVICTIGDFDPTDEEFDTYQKEETELINQPGICQIYDLTHVKLLRAELRIKQGKWTETYKEISKKNIRGIAFYCPTIWGSMVLKAIFLVSRPIIPYVIVKTMSEAFEYADQQLKEAGTK